jgi:hypothetical protein
VPDRVEDFIASAMDTGLYTIGAYFHDRHAELADDVVSESQAIEQGGLRAYSDREGVPLETAFETLVTGLAVRYYRAVNR